MARRPSDPRAAAEAAFKPKAPVAPPAPIASAIPGAREQVTLRLDQDVLLYFQEDGAGWQDRINAALRDYVQNHGGFGEPQSIPVDELSSANDDGVG
ncbi:BrnA antitoxin family protein [Methylopila turkensis]|nr:BrnA antitoxin family protein [Methylopila turkensis]